MPEPEAAREEHEALERLLDLVARWSGHVIPIEDPAPAHRLLRERARVCGCRTIAEYLALVEDDTGRRERQALLGAFTNKESYLFRGREQLEALGGSVLPELVEGLGRQEELVVWSAASARGEEPATLAVVLAESPVMEGVPWRIVATDVDHAALEAGRRGIFSRRAVSRVPPDLLARHFEPVEAGYALAPGLQERITFRMLNLVDRPWPFPPGSLHVVFLRNVLIYFGAESRRQVAEEVERVLAPGGWVFTGPGESLLHAAPGIEPVDLGTCLVYRKPSGSGGARVGPVPGNRAKRPQGGKPGVQDPLAEVAGLLRSGGLTAARSALQAALASAPDDPALHLARGVCAERSELWEEAVAAYRAVLYLDPGLHPVRLLLARALERVGWPGRARRERAVAARHLSGSILPLPRGWVMLGLPPPEDLLDQG